MPALALVAACGFEPVYGTGGAGSALYGKIEVAAPNDEETYVLVRELEQRLGRATEPAYDLSLALSTGRQGQAITAEGDITRFSIVGQVSYTLVERGTQREVAKGVSRNFTGYSATGSTVETLAAERDAQVRLMTLLADQITVELLSTADLGQ